MTPILLALYGAALNRWRGHASQYKRYFPRPLPQISLALPYAYVAWRWADPELVLSIVRPLQDVLPIGMVAVTALTVISMPVLILTTLGWLTGHGQYFLEVAKKFVAPETLDFIVRMYFGRDPRTNPDTNDYELMIWAYGETLLYWRCVAGMAVTGLAVTLPAGIATMNTALALSGALKAPAYMIGHKVKPDYATAIGEALTGLFLLGALGILA